MLVRDRCVSSSHLLTQVQIKRQIWPGFQWQSGLNARFWSNEQGISGRFMYLSWNIMSLKTESGFTSHWHAVSMTHLFNVPLVPGSSSCFLWLHTIKHLLNKNMSWKLNKLSLCLKHLRSVGKKAKEICQHGWKRSLSCLGWIRFGFPLQRLSIICCTNVSLRMLTLEQYAAKMITV